MYFTSEGVYLSLSGCKVVPSRSLRLVGCTTFHLARPAAAAASAASAPRQNVQLQSLHDASFNFKSLWPDNYKEVWDHTTCHWEHVPVSGQWKKKKLVSVSVRSNSLRKKLNVVIVSDLTPCCVTSESLVEDLVSPQFPLPPTTYLLPSGLLPFAKSDQANSP